MMQESRREGEARRRRCCRTAARILSPEFFRALCEPTRVALLVRLAERGRPCTVSELAGCCPVDISVVSRHLAVLRGAGIVEATRRGKTVLYQVRYSAVSGHLRHVADAIDDCCPEKNPCESPKESSHVQ